MTNEERQIVINAVYNAKKEYLEELRKQELYLDTKPELHKARAAYMSLKYLAAELGI